MAVTLILKFLTVKEMLNGINPFVKRNLFCTGCFDSNYGDNNNISNNNISVDIEDCNRTRSFSFNDVKHKLAGR